MIGICKGNKQINKWNNDNNNEIIFKRVNVNTGIF